MIVHCSRSDLQSIRVETAPLERRAGVDADDEALVVVHFHRAAIDDGWAEHPRFAGPADPHLAGRSGLAPVVERLTGISLTTVSPTRYGAQSRAAAGAASILMTMEYFVSRFRREYPRENLVPAKSKFMK